MGRALVLSGGGSRGAYECGAWQALCELNIRFDGIYGTSIGAINAALVAQGNLQAAIDIWTTIDMNSIASRDDGEEINIEYMLSRKRDLIPFLVENAKNLQLDVAPLEKLLNEKVDESKIRASGLKLGMMLTNVRHLNGMPARLEDIPQGQLTEYLLASSACFPVFPARKIDDHIYIDGGFVDNMPIGMAIEDGMDEIVAIDIHPQPVHPEYENMPFVRLIHPLRDLGNFLDFDRANMERSRLKGYNDTMKSYGVLDGISYSFRHINELDTFEAAHRYLNAVAMFDARANEKKEESTLIGKLTVETPKRKLSWKESLMGGLELCMSIMEFREEGIYSFNDQTELLLKYVKNNPESSEAIQNLSKLDRRARMRVIYYFMKTTEKLTKDDIKKMADFSTETAAAMFLLTMEGTKIGF